MHTPVPLGVTGGAIDVTSAAVGKLSDSRRGYSIRGASLSAMPPKATLIAARRMSVCAKSGHDRLSFVADLSLAVPAIGNLSRPDIS